MKAINKVISPTTAVRRLMRAHGACQYLTFTNKYKTCRTVKCYLGQIKDIDQFETELIDLYESLELGSPQLKTTESYSQYRNTAAVIVRIPFSIQPK